MTHPFRVSKIVREHGWADLMICLDFTSNGYIAKATRLSGRTWLVLLVSDCRDDLEIMRKYKSH